MSEAVRLLVDEAVRPRKRSRLFGALGLCLALGGSLAACSNMSGSTAQQVREWSNGAGFPSANAQLNTDLAELAAGQRLGNLKELRTACAGFGVDAATLQGELPTPVTTITDELNDALSDYYDASTDCYQASSFHSAPFLSYERVLANGKRLYDQARKLLAADDAS